MKYLKEKRESRDCHEGKNFKRIEQKMSLSSIIANSLSNWGNEFKVRAQAQNGENKKYRVCVKNETQAKSVKKGHPNKW